MNKEKKYMKLQRTNAHSLDFKLFEGERVECLEVRINELRNYRLQLFRKVL